MAYWSGSRSFGTLHWRLHDLPLKLCELLSRLQPALSNLSVMSASAASDPLYHAANSLQVMIVQRLADSMNFFMEGDSMCFFMEEDIRGNLFAIV
jgi:hypothetical protein